MRKHRENTAKLMKNKRSLIRKMKSLYYKERILPNMKKKHNLISENIDYQKKEHDVG